MSEQQVLLEIAPSIAPEKLTRPTVGAAGRGRPKGTRGKRQRAMREFLDHFRVQALESLVAGVLRGEPEMMRMYLDRVYPKPQRATIRLEHMPAIHSAADARAAMGTLIEQAAIGELAPDDALSLMQMCAAYLQAQAISAPGGGISAPVTDAREMLAERLARVIEARSAGAGAIEAPQVTVEHTEAAEGATEGATEPPDAPLSLRNDELEAKFAELQRRFHGQR